MPLEAQRVGAPVGRGKLGEGHIGRDVHRLRDGIVDVRLQRGLHFQLRVGADLRHGDKGFRQRVGATLQAGEFRQRMTFDRHAHDGSVRLPDAAVVRKREHRLDSTRYVAGQQADRSRRRNGGQMAVADPVTPYCRLQVGGSACTNGAAR